MNFAQSVGTVWLRYFAVFRKNLAHGVVITFVEPILYLLSFGFGLGGMIGSIDVAGVHVSYRAFVLAGLIGQSILTTAFFDASYGGFVRMYYQRVFQAIAVTPVTLSEVLWGELLWCATRALLSTTVILSIGVLLGDFQLEGSLLVLPLAFFCAFVFAAMGMIVAALASTIEALSYPQFLLVFPMFLFCGTYFPLTNLPSWLQTIAAFFPLTAVHGLVRGLVLGFGIPWWAPLNLLFWLTVLVPWARRAMRKRLTA